MLFARNSYDLLILDLNLAYLNHFCSLIKIISGVRQVSTLYPVKTQYRVLLFCKHFFISNPEEVMFLKPAFVGSEYRFYGFRSELQEEEYCRPEPGFPPQLW